MAGIRNLPAPLQGAQKIAGFVARTASALELATQLQELNGQPALVFTDGGAPFAALLIAIADGRIHRIFFHANLLCLRHLGLPT